MKAAEYHSPNQTCTLSWYRSRHVSDLVTRSRNIKLLNDSFIAKSLNLSSLNNNLSSEACRVTVLPIQLHAGTEGKFGNLPLVTVPFNPPMKRSEKMIDCVGSGNNSSNEESQYGIVTFDRWFLSVRSNLKQASGHKFCYTVSIWSLYLFSNNCNYYQIQ